MSTFFYVLVLFDLHKDIKHAEQPGIQPTVVLML